MSGSRSLVRRVAWLSRRASTRSRAFRTCSLLVLALLFVRPEAGRAADLEPGITLRVDEAQVYAGDSVMLEIEGVGLVEPPDLDALSRDADLVGETGGTRIGVVGGQVVEVWTRRLELLPREEGRAFFGPVSGESIAGTVRSNAVTVDVLPPPDVDWSPGPDDATVAFTLSTTTPVVGERIVADLVLRHRHAIAGEEIALPAFDGFDVLPVHERRRTVVEDEDGGAWRQIAWRWLLFPTRSGPASIESVRWRGEMIRSRTQRGPFSLDAPTLAVEVAPARTGASNPGDPDDPGGAIGTSGTSGSDDPGGTGGLDGTSGADSWWLPARNVTLSESWSTDLRALSAGDEFVRTITLSAEDVLARQLPDVVPYESRAIESTPIAARREQRLVGERLIATATFTFRMQARSPVPVFLDTVRVSWWDTVERRSREAIVPARRINVGLPERADLLAELALADRGIDRVRLALASVGRRTGELRASVIALGAWACWLGFATWRDRRRARRGAGILPEL